MSVQIYTADQAAQLLGCSVKTVEELARQGELPGIKPGGGWVFRPGRWRSGWTNWRWNRRPGGAAHRQHLRWR